METPRHILVCAMLADAADECMALIRFVDQEHFDVSFLSDNVADFMERVVQLFGEESK